jgi:hypothetical protein
MILKRFIVWLLEISCQVPLLMALLLAQSGRSSQRNLGDDLGLLFFGTAVVFMVGSGYLLTTAIVGVFLRSRKVWVYPMIAATLFVIHEQFLFTGWKLPDASHVETQVFGACIVFVCTFGGNWLLRKWGSAGVQGPSLHRGGLPGDARV